MFPPHFRLFTMSLLGAQLEKFQGGIFIPAEETPIFFLSKPKIEIFCHTNISILHEFFASCNNNHYTDLMKYLRHSKSSGSDDLNR